MLNDHSPALSPQQLKDGCSARFRMSVSRRSIRKRDDPGGARKRSGWHTVTPQVCCKGRVHVLRGDPTPGNRSPCAQARKARGSSPRRRPPAHPPRRRRARAPAGCPGSPPRACWASASSSAARPPAGAGRGRLWPRVGRLDPGVALRRTQTDQRQTFLRFSAHRRWSQAICYRACPENAKFRCARVCVDYADVYGF